MLRFSGSSQNPGSSVLDELQLSNGAFHCMVRYSSARLGTVRYGSVRVGLRFHCSLVLL